MNKSILVKITVDWEDYEENVDNQLIFEDTGILDNLKDGVSIELIGTLNTHSICPSCNCTDTLETFTFEVFRCKNCLNEFE